MLPKQLMFQAEQCFQNTPKKPVEKEG